MATRNNVYKCPKTGSLVEVLVGGECELGDLQLLKENTTDAATEKHVPVGEVEHPMTAEHSIQWIELITENNEVLRKYLDPSEKPVAVFKTDAKEVYAREYCNLHGLWRSK